MSSQVTMPDFSPEDIARASAKKTLNPGWYRFITTDSKLEVSRNGHYMIVTRNAPLEDPEDGESRVTKLSVRNNIVMPFDNPEAEEQKAPDTTGLVGQYLRAIGVEVPTFPRTIDGVLIYNGEEIEKADEDACRQEVTEMVWNTAYELMQDPGQLVDSVFYGKVVQNGDFTNIENPRQELPDDAVLVAPEEFMAEPEVAAKPKKNGKAGKATTSSKKGGGKKKASKKKGRK